MVGLDDLLWLAYRRAVRRRGGHVGPDRRPRSLGRVARYLSDHRLCWLWVEAQFAAMPTGWCLSKFGRPYPPANVVFGGNAIRRYREYVDRGVRCPIR